MSSKARKAHAKLQPDPCPPVTPGEGVDIIDAFAPDYGRQCVTCGQTPCVNGLHAGRVVYQGELCGVCMWGETDCLDPAKW